MKHFIKKNLPLMGLVLTAMALPIYAQVQTEPKLGPNTLKNDSFEDGTKGWQIPKDTAKVVNDIARSGEHSLRYINTDPERKYEFFNQKLDVKPGQHLYFSIWVKGKDVQGDKTGVSVYMTSSEGSIFLGESYPKGLFGTFDWTQITGEFVVPSAATSTTIGPRVRDGITGTMWFDDLEVRAKELPSLKTHLQYPNYRGMVVKGSGDPWRFQVEVNKQPEWKNNPITITNILTNIEGKVLLKKTSKLDTSQKRNVIAIQSPKELPVGDFVLRQTISDPNGEVQLQNQYPIQVVSEMPKVYVDKQGFTIVSGKRFFPMGVYLVRVSESTDEHLERIAEGGFNTILNYAYGDAQGHKEGVYKTDAYMERAQQHGLKVLLSLRTVPGKGGFKDRKDTDVFDYAADYIKSMRDKPALLAWYSNDEMGKEWLPGMQKMYDIFKRFDPDHPTFQVQNKKDQLEKDAEITDILAPDPYPVGPVKKGSRLTSTSTMTRLTIDAAHGAKGVWVVPQMMDWAVYKEGREAHPPSLNEMRNQAYQAIINGATGLIWYSYFDLKYEKYPRKENENMDLFHRRWKDASAMAKEINSVVPIILSNNKVPIIIPKDAEVEAAAWQDGEALLIMLANPYYEEKSISFELPKGWKIKEANQGQIKSTFADGKVTFTLPSIGSGVFRLAKS